MSTLFLTEMWERNSYYGMRAILILYMTTPSAREGLGFDISTSGAIYGLYTAAVYLSALPGGWIADHLIGQRKAIWYGGIAIMFGHIALGISWHPSFFLIGLILVALGTGLLKTSISSVIGSLYPEGGSRRESAFAIFYAGINLGAIIGQIIVPLVAEKVSWHLGFSLAAVGMLIGLVYYKLTEKRLGSVGVKPVAPITIKTRSIMSVVFWLAVIGSMVGLAQYLQWVDLTDIVEVAQWTGVVILLITTFFFVRVFLDRELSGQQKKNVLVILVLFLGSACFWSGFEQSGSSLNLFARDLTDRWILGWEIPTGWLQNLNPIFIVLLATPMAMLWKYLDSIRRNPQPAYKFSVGLLLMGFGFLIMYTATQVGKDPEVNSSMGWLISTYLVFSLGELVLSPVGLSSVTVLAPKKYYGQMMGIWFTGAAVGNLIAGLAAASIDEITMDTTSRLFLGISRFGFLSSVVLFAFAALSHKWLSRGTKPRK